MGVIAVTSVLARKGMSAVTEISVMTRRGCTVISTRIMIIPESAKLNNQLIIQRQNI